jgi:hypothetical protein
MFKKKFGLTTMVLATALALFTPVMASAHSRDEYRNGCRREHVRGYYDRAGCWHRY